MTRLFACISGFALNATLCTALAATALFAWLAPQLPGQADIDNTRLRQPLRIYSADGWLIGEFGGERRRPLAFDNLPPTLIQAFLAAEDSRFFEHPGIDLRGLLRAAGELLQTGRPRQGGSTITMQLARNLYLGREKTFRRKLAELLIALRLEARLSKRRIFELYLNKIYFGHRAYGIVAAARTYYGLPVDQLSLAQMAMLAGLPQAPSSHNPLDDPQRARQRRDRILGRMLSLGYIDESRHAAATAAVDDARLHRPGVELEAPYAADMARRQVLERFGEAAYDAGLRVVTTLDAGLQRAANRSLRGSLLDYERRHAYRPAPPPVQPEASPSPRHMDLRLATQPAHAGLRPGILVKGNRVYVGQGRHARLSAADRKWAGRKLRDGDLVWLRDTSEGSVLSQPPRVQGALVALAPADGAVLALSGGYDFRHSQFNRAVDARRQPGSAFKPLVYAAALSRGWTPASLLDDSPLAIADGSGRVWRPANFDGRFLGSVRLREALAQSRNLAAVNLLQAVGIDYARDFLGRFGLPAHSLPEGLSLVLGSGEASPLDMAGAYARFANGGFGVPPYLIREIRNARGRLLFQADPAVAPAMEPTAAGEPAAQSLALSKRLADRVLEPRLAWQMHSLLQEVIRSGTGRGALSLGREDLAGKTGTSNDVRDSWFCGYHPRLVAVAWMGHDDYSPLGRRETGGRAALGMWTQFMGRILEDLPEVLPPPPAGMRAVRIDPESGLLTGPDDPYGLDEMVREEYEIMLLGPGGPAAPRPAETADTAPPEAEAQPSERAREPAARTEPAADGWLRELF